jgi:enoyl-CoA hydratase/carnithine racemase
MTEVVLVDIQEGVAEITLNRPDRLNAWTGELERAYFGALEDCGARPDVRAILVTGAGRGFCAGADMDDLQAIGSNGGREEDAGRRKQTFPTTIPKPIVAAINGACAGIGLVQALMCDVRFAAAEAKFTTAFARRGLVAEHGISWILPRLVGPARALDLLLSGRVLLGAEAAEIGLVNRAVEGGGVLEEARAYVRDMAANCAPSSMASMKRQVYAALDQDIESALQEANGLMVASLAADDFREGVASFVEKRPPAFASL